MAASNSTFKRCTRCGTEKPFSAFSNMAASGDGRAPHCRVCAAKRYAEWRAANKERLRASKAAYHAANRQRLNVISKAWYEANIDFAKACGAAYRSTRKEEAKARSVAWRAANTKRSRGTVKAWRAANPDKAKGIVAAWNAAHPEARRVYGQNRAGRKRGGGGRLSRGIAAKLFKLQRGKCACCGRPLGDDYHLDHRMPIALGGAHEDGNMQLLRAICNLQKNAKDPIDFMQERGFLL